MGNVELLMTALEYIEAHLGDDIRTEELAAVCYCSRSTLEKMFRCVYHISVHDYVIRRRMMRSARELADRPDKSILTIAMEYGYSTHESFARAFEQIWNCKPSEFRKRKYAELFPRFRVIPENGGNYEMGAKNVDISELYDLFQERNGCYFVCCDIRGLTQINQISHKAGDLAILEAMNRLNHVVGDEDVVFRIGGDEFCILTGSREQEYARKIAEEIQARNGGAFSFEGKEIPLSLYTAVICPDKRKINYAELYTGLQNAIYKAACECKRGQ